MMRWLVRTSALAVSALCATAGMAACDRVCLGGALDRYLAAMVAHAPARAGLAKGAKLTENGVVTTTASGMWRDVTAIGALDRRYFDPEAGQAAFYGLIDEKSGPAVTMIRIRVRGSTISEVETIAGRSTERIYDPKGMVATPPGAAPPPGARLSRAALAVAANGYFDAMQAHSAAGVAHHPDCLRLENGHTAGASCVDGLERLTQISAVGHRHTSVIDTEAGAVVMTAMFLRPPGAMMPNGQPWKRNLFLQLLQIDSGGVRLAAGAMHYLEPADPDTSGWADEPAR